MTIRAFGLGRPLIGAAVRRPGGWLTWMCAAVLTLAVLIAISGPLLVGDPNSSNLSDAFASPSGAHPLGFDSQGRDLLTRLIVGARSALPAAAAVAILAVVLAVGLSLVTAWFGGKVDTAISTVCNIIFGFPGILLVIVAAAALGTGLRTAIAALTIAYTPFVVRILRSSMLEERSREHIAAASVLGLSTWTIWTRHLMPNVMPTIASQLTLMFGYATVDLATISFLGLGVQPPNPDWGLMVADGKTGLLAGYPQESVYAGLCLVTVVIAMNILGERIASQDQ